MESPDLRQIKVQLRRTILGLDKIARLLFSYAGDRLKPASFSVAGSDETALTGLKEKALLLRQDFESSFDPTWNAIWPAKEIARGVSPQLLEAQDTLRDLVAEPAGIEDRPQKTAGSRHKPSLFVPDAFTNPRHAQFAIKVALAGMIGYLFYTASDYYGTLICPESAALIGRERLAACMGAIVRLLHLGRSRRWLSRIER